MSSLKEKIVSGVFWQFLEKLGSQGFLFFISIILARLLEPEEFGIVAIIIVLIQLCNSVVDCGFSTAIIQKKDADDIDCSTVFYFNLITAFVFYIILYISSPYIAEFYQKEKLVVYIRVMSLLLLTNASFAMQSVILRKRMMFKHSFKITWSSCIISSFVSVLLAFCGCGVWALILSQLVGSIVSSILFWYIIRWFPKKDFSFSRLKKLFSFGSKLFLSSLMDKIYYDMFALFLGKVYQLQTLAFYNRGQAISSTALGVVSGVVSGVTLPALSQLQEDREKMKKLLQQSIKTIMFIVVPSMVGLALFADPVVRIIFSEKWLACVIFLQLSCLFRFFIPVDVLNLQTTIACGRSDINLILEIIKKVQFIIVIICTYRFGLVTMVAGISVCGILFFIENAWMSKKLVKYSPLQQFLDILPFILVALFAAVCSFFALRLFHSAWLRLGIGGTIFSIIYLLLSWKIRIIPDIYLELFAKILSWRKKKSAYSERSS